MKKHLIFLVLIFVNIQSFAQKIDTDIFGNLVYKSREGNYEAYFKKNVFDDLVFSDSNGNETTLKKKYILFEYRDLLENEEARLDVFRALIYENKHESNHKLSYSVNIFDKIEIEDNKGRKVEIGKDIFGNDSYEEKNKKERSSIKKDILGVWEYKANNVNATLEKDIFNIWIYKDSRGNEFKFSNETWSRLKKRFRTEVNILNYLVQEFIIF